MKTTTVLLIAGIMIGCSPAETPSTRPEGSGLTLACSMATLDFRVGEQLPPPGLAITNTTDWYIELIGPTLSVVSCSLLQPDSTLVELRLAMPTGRDPAAMPGTRLQPGASIDFAPSGIWYYVDGVGYEPYVFEREGTYRIWCRYDAAASDTVTLEVHGEQPRAVGRPVSR